MSMRVKNIENLKKGGIKNAEVFYEILINDFCKGDLDKELNKFWGKNELAEQLKKGFTSTEDMAYILCPLIDDFVKGVKNTNLSNNIVFELTGRFEILSKIMIEGADEDHIIHKDTIDETPIADIQLLFETREICDEVARQIKNLNSKKPSKKITYVYLKFDKKYEIKFENKAKREKINDIEIGVELKSSSKLYMLRIILCEYFQGYNDPLMKKMCELNCVELQGESQCGIYKFIVEELREKPLLTEDELIDLFKPKEAKKKTKPLLKKRGKTAFEKVVKVDDLRNELKEVDVLTEENNELKVEIDELKVEVDVLTEENNELKKEIVEIQTDYVKVLQSDEYPFFVTFSKTRFIKDTKEIIKLFHKLHETNEKFVNLIKNYNTICVIQGIHTDYNRFEKSQHITGYLFNTTTYVKSNNLHFYLTSGVSHDGRSDYISSITEVTNLI